MDQPQAEQQQGLPQDQPQAEQPQAGNADPLPELEPVRPICCPCQYTIDDVPYIVFDIDQGLIHFEDVEGKRIGRAIRLAPVLYYGRPVTPMENPMTHDSHHMIRMKSSSNPKYLVDLLFGDVNWYYKGFRRAVRDEHGIYQWGNWFRFRDPSIALPAYAALDSEVMNHRGDHDDETTIGGCDVLRDIFYGFACYPDRRHDIARIGRAVRCTAMYFCEAPRFRSINRAVVNRLQNGGVSTLGLKTKNRIGSWGVMSRFVLRTARNNGVIDAELAATLASYRELYAINSLAHLIGPEGDLRILLRDEEILVDAALRAALEAPGAAQAVPNHGFLGERSGFGSGFDHV